MSDQDVEHLVKQLFRQTFEQVYNAGCYIDDVEYMLGDLFRPTPFLNHFFSLVAGYEIGHRLAWKFSGDADFLAHLAHAMTNGPYMRTEDLMHLLQVSPLLASVGQMLQKVFNFC
jgi:hypothetical protein